MELLAERPNEIWMLGNFKRLRQQTLSVLRSAPPVWKTLQKLHDLERPFEVSPELKESVE